MFRISSPQRMRPRYLLQFNTNIIEKPSQKVPLKSKTKERETARNQNNLSLPNKPLSGIHKADLSKRQEKYSENIKRTSNFTTVEPNDIK